MKKAVACLVSAALLGASFPGHVFAAEGRAAAEPGATFSAAPWTAAQKMEFMRELDFHLGALRQVPALPGAAYLSEAFKAPATPAQLAARQVLVESLARPGVRDAVAASLGEAQGLAEPALVESVSRNLKKIGQDFDGHPAAAAVQERLVELRRLVFQEVADRGDALLAVLGHLNALFDSASSSPAQPEPSPLAVSLEARRSSTPLSHRAVNPPGLAVLEKIPPYHSAEFPTGARILDRSGFLGVGLKSLGEAILAAKDTQDAAVKLASLGVLMPSEAPLDEGDLIDFNFVLHRLWLEAASAVEAPYRVDNTWQIPAAVVSRGGVDYYIHGVPHDAILTSFRQGSAVRRLAARLGWKNLPLYSEQNLPAFYGYEYGRETLDHQGDDGREVPVRDVVPRWPAGLLAHLPFLTVLALGAAPFFLSAYWVASHPDSVWAWLTLVAAAIATWAVTAKGLRPHWAVEAQTLVFEKTKPEDWAHHYREYLGLVRQSPPDLEILRRVELPMPLKASEEGSTSPRSKAMAEAIAEDAAGKAHRRVHILTGLNHVVDLAWHLTH